MAKEIRKRLAEWKKSNKRKRNFKKSRLSRNNESLFEGKNLRQIIYILETARVNAGVKENPPTPEREAAIKRAKDRLKYDRKTTMEKIKYTITGRW